MIIVASALYTVNNITISDSTCCTNDLSLAVISPGK